MGKREEGKPKTNGRVSTREFFVFWGLHWVEWKTFESLKIRVSQPFLLKLGKSKLQE